MKQVLRDPLTQDRRYAVCVHEAAHAVVHAIGGNSVYAVAVAPLGNRGDWTYEARKGRPMSDLWGVCETSDMGSYAYFVRWNEEEGGYALDQPGWAQYRASLRVVLKDGLSPLYQSIRAHVCAALAGPIGEAIYAGEEPPLEAVESGEGEDFTKAEAFCWLLPFTREFEYLHAATSELLQEPEVWRAVITLADALDKTGSLDDESLAALLPANRNWPSSPRHSALWKGRAALLRELRASRQAR